MNSNNKLEVKDSKDIKVLNLIEGDIETKAVVIDTAGKVKDKEFITIAERQQVINRDYGDFKLNEVESKSFHDWDMSSDMAIKECKEFMEKSADQPGQTYSGKNKIPYGLESLEDGSFNILPMPFEEEIKERKLKLI